ncbi:MAG: response regulator [Lachnospiraceae bacterium]|nr:response regulator [Lachnospiraceae bacterium]
MDKEHQISFHIMLLTVFTGLSLLLILIILISDWGHLAILPISGGLLLCWIFHFLKIGSDEQRLYLYVVMELLVLGYYALQGSTITDVPILLCILIILLSKKNDKRLIYMVAASYLVYLLGNIIFTDYIGPHTEQIVFSRILLGVVCLITACSISVSFIHQYENVDQELAETMEKLRASQKENELFLANMSHELRTPINAVNGISEMLLNGKLSPKEKRGIGVIRSAGRRLFRQVSDVLDYSEIETGHFSLACDEYEPVSVIHDAVNIVCDSETGILLQGQRRDKKIDIAIDLKPSLPKVLYGDADRLKKLIVALLDNAVKFTDAGGVFLYIWDREEKYGVNLNMDFWDTGCGIPKEKQKQLFEGSYLGDNSAERKTGVLGLGLSIAHGIVTAMHGFITIESMPNEGTHVHVSVPQEVRSSESSLTLEHPERYHVLCYFNREKYVRSEMGSYFHTMIEHLRTELGIDAATVDSLQEAKELCASGVITHLYTAEWEYAVEPEYFDQMAKKISVCVFADKNFRTNAGSLVDVLYKPIFVLATINHLRDTLTGTLKSSELEKKENANEEAEKVCRALVVDDEEMNLVVARGHLENAGLQVEVCDSGEMAVEKCSVAAYDIIFMDYMMPKMNGTKAMKKIRQVRNGFYKDKPIVVFTANAVSGAKEGFLEEGFDDFISKPIESKKLAKILEKYLPGGTK